HYDQQVTADFTVPQLQYNNVVNMFSAVLKGKGNYLQIRFIDQFGIEQVRLDRSFAEGAVQIVATESRQDKSHRGYFKQAIQLPADQYYLSPLNLNRENGKIEEPHRPVLRVAKALYGTQEEVRGIVVINIDMNSMLEALKLESGQAWLLNSQQEYLYHPDKEKRFGFDLQHPEYRFPEYWIDGIDSKEALQVIPPDGTFQWVPSLHRVVSKEQFQIHPDDDERSWTLIRTLPGAAILDPLREMVFAVLLTLTLLIIAIVVRSTKLFVRPIERLMGMARAIGRGDFTARINTNSLDELGQLSATFNQMAHALQQSKNSLHNVEEALSAMDDLLVVVDQQGDIKQVNRAVTQTMGVSSDKLLGKPLQLLFDEEEQQLGRGRFSTEVTRMLGGHMQSRLEQNPQQFEEILHQAPLATWLSREDGTIDIANDAAHQLLHYSEKSMEGMNIEQLLPAEMQHQHATLWTSFLARGRSRMVGENQVATARCGDGTPISVQLNLYRLQRDNEPVVVVVMRDAFTVEDWLQVEPTPFGRLLDYPDEQGTFQGMERQLRLANGSTLPVLISGKVVYETAVQGEHEDSEERLQQVILVIKDISQLRRTELELDEREQLTKQLQQRSDELKEKMGQMEMIHQAFVERENRVIEMKREINQLKEQLGEVAPYNMEGL
ncbi:MAG: PAS domain S-box protein, partial [Gammaproteobacteria bacterium]|nr:PAS domain S-box protein [Gammaproteobacteria bacterium]